MKANFARNQPSKEAEEEGIPFLESCTIKGIQDFPRGKTFLAEAKGSERKGAGRDRERPAGAESGFHNSPKSFLKY